MVSLKEVRFFLPLNHGLVLLRGRDSCETPHVIKSDGKSRILKDGSNILANTGFEPPMWNFDNSKSHLAKSVLWQTRDLCHNWYSLEGWTHLLSIFTKFHCSFYFGATGALSYQILQLTHWFPTERKGSQSLVTRGTWLLSSQKNVTPLKLTWNPSKSRVGIKLRCIFLIKRFFLTTGLEDDFPKRPTSPQWATCWVSFQPGPAGLRTTEPRCNTGAQHGAGIWDVFFFFFGWWTIKNLRTSLWGLFIDIFDMIISIQPLPDIPRFPTKRLLLGES